MHQYDETYQFHDSYQMNALEIKYSNHWPGKENG